MALNLPILRAVVLRTPYSAWEYHNPYYQYLTSGLNAVYLPNNSTSHNWCVRKGPYLHRATGGTQAGQALVALPARLRFRCMHPRPALSQS